MRFARTFEKILAFGRRSRRVIRSIGFLVFKAFFYTEVAISSPCSTHDSRVDHEGEH